MSAEQNAARVRYALAVAMEAASEQGVPDAVVANEVVKLALSIIGAANGGPHAVPDALERLAHQMREGGELAPVMH